MDLRVERRADRVHTLNTGLPERVDEELERERYTFRDRFDARRLGSASRDLGRTFEAIDDREQIACEAFERVFVCVLDVALRAAAHVLGLRLRAEHLVAGLAGGITGTLFGAGGPPYAMYLSRRGLAKEQFRATMGFAAMTSISLRMVAFFATGLLLDRSVWLSAVFVVPAAYVGISVAKHIYLRISREALLRAIFVLLLFSGGSLILRALG